MPGFLSPFRFHTRETTHEADAATVIGEYVASALRQMIPADPNAARGSLSQQVNYAPLTMGNIHPANDTYAAKMQSDTM